MGEKTAYFSIFKHFSASGASKNPSDNLILTPQALVEAFPRVWQIPTAKMTETLHIIPLRTVRFNDRNSILSAYSLERGPLSLTIPEGKGKGAVRARALTAPLTLIEAEVDIRPGRTIYPLRDPRAILPLSSVRSNPVKIAISQFLAEVLASMFREGQPDEILYRFVADSIEILDSLEMGRIANFHLCFLYHLSHIVGVGPDLSGWSEGSVFDLREGRYTCVLPPHPDFLAPAESATARILDRLSYPTMHLLRLNREQRNRILDIELQFLSIHYSSLASLKSTEVLRSLF